MRESSGANVCRANARKSLAREVFSHVYGWSIRACQNLTPEGAAVRTAPLATLLLSLACAAAPPVEPGRAALWGTVRLIPKAGATSSADAYSDRRVRGAELADYSQTGYAVVYVDSAAGGAPARLELSIEASGNGAALRPALAAALVGRAIAISNRTPQTQVVSAPAAAWLVELAPGERVEFLAGKSGELGIHVLGAERGSALVWVSPGSFAIAGAGGRYELRNLPPGPVAVRAWHPRLPPTAASAIELRAGEVARLDLEIGVDRRELTR